MNEIKPDREILDPRLITVVVLAAVSIGCSMFGKSDGLSSNSKARKGISAEQICSSLAHPQFENKSPYDGQSCSGSTYFAAKEGSASGAVSGRAAFSYYVLAENGSVQKINLSMSRRQDGADFFMAEGNAVAKAVSGEALPKEIQDAITAPLPASGGLAGYGDRFTTNAQVGGAKIELIRTNSDSGYALTFQL